MKSDPVASVQWFDGQQALTWALQAYYAACRQIEPPDATPLEEWVSGGDFLQAFHAQFTVRLSLAAYALGVERSGSASEVLGWPDRDGSECEASFLQLVQRFGLSLPDLAADNAVLGGVS